jgi:hypothetical protein
MDRIQTHRDSGTSSSSQAVLIFYTKVYTKVDSAHLVRATPWLHGGVNEWTQPGGTRSWEWRETQTQNIIITSSSSYMHVLCMAQERAAGPRLLGP